MLWEEDFKAYLQDLDFKKPVIICGDLNVAHKEIDLKNPKTNHKNAGFTDEERNKMTKLLEAGFSDTYRIIYPNKENSYTWWSYMGNAREKNIGWRIDYSLFDNVNVPNVYFVGLPQYLHTGCFSIFSFILMKVSVNPLKLSYLDFIYDDIFGSDHCPIGIEIKEGEF